MLDTQAFLQNYHDMVTRTKLPKGIGEKFRLKECLRQRDDRETWMAEGEDGQIYVLKIRTAGGPDSLRREYDILRRLSHPRLPHAVSYLEEEDREYLVRSYIPGSSLEETIGRDGPLLENRAAELLLSLCGVLQYLHGLNPPVIHRDIKPQNVILTPEGECALIDFGTAREYRKGGGGRYGISGDAGVCPSGAVWVWTD